jgi:hypothetical protein
MRRSFAIAGLMAAVSLAAGPAFAFQETPAPPPEASGPAPQANAPALQLGTPGAAPASPQADSKGGVKVFGYSILPKLNFGLDLLYGQDQQQQMDLQGPTFEDENPDVTVLGKVKRRF